MLTFMKIGCVAVVATILSYSANAAEMKVHSRDTFTSVPFQSTNELLLTQPHAKLTRGSNEQVWISDVELLSMPDDKSDIFIANAPHKKLLGAGNIQAGKTFQLFPYHYIEPHDGERIGKDINYRLVLCNESTETAVIKIDGMGSVTDWDHGSAWNQALTGQNAQIIELKPKSEFTLWNPQKLKSGLPYSAVVLGKLIGSDIHVYDYCYTGSEDPGLAGCSPIPDLTWAPSYHPSFIRGTTDWFNAKIEIFPMERDAQGALPVSKLRGQMKSVSFGFSPGGPISNLCDYKAVTPSFIDDVCLVTDPVSSAKHIFFGGNYPMIYAFDLPIKNDLEKPVTVDFLLASNDKFGVHSYTGIWMGKHYLEQNSPAIAFGNRWKVWTLQLAPGERYDANLRVVGLGGRWGGLVATVNVTD